MSYVVQVKKSPDKSGDWIMYTGSSIRRRGDLIFYHRVRWKQSDCDVLFSCGLLIPCGHLLFAYAGGIREQISCGVCGVDTFFFYLALFKFFPFTNKLPFLFCYTHQGTIPAVCERTAKVGDFIWFLASGLVFLRLKDLNVLIALVCRRKWLHDCRNLRQNQS